jgi:hypothetical protein
MSYRIDNKPLRLPVWIIMMSFVASVQSAVKKNRHCVSNPLAATVKCCRLVPVWAVTGSISPRLPGNGLQGATLLVDCEIDKLAAVTD